MKYGDQAEARLTDLSKALGLDVGSCTFWFSYLDSRKQNESKFSYTDFDEIFTGVPQGFILDSLLFNIYIVDLIDNIGNLSMASYADNNDTLT